MLYSRGHFYQTVDIDHNNRSLNIWIQADRFPSLEVLFNLSISFQCIRRSAKLSHVYIQLPHEKLFGAHLCIHISPKKRPLKWLKMIIFIVPCWSIRPLKQDVLSQIPKIIPFSAALFLYSNIKIPIFEEFQRQLSRRERWKIKPTAIIAQLNEFECVNTQPMRNSFLRLLKCVNGLIKLKRTEQIDDSKDSQSATQTFFFRCNKKWSEK